MAVYIDPLKRCQVRRGFCAVQWKESCHMFANTNEELVEMGVEIRLPPGSLQKKSGLPPHFDLKASKRQMAVAAGAVELTMLEMRRWLRERRIALRGT